MPFNFHLFIKLFRMAFRDASPRRKKMLRFVLVVTPVFVLVNQVFLLLDYLFFPGFRRIHVEKPIFIIGHGRSGTSLLHRLMCGDDQTFSWVMMYEMLLPSILQRKLIRFIARMDDRHWESKLAKRVHAWEDRVFAKGRQMHPMNLDGPEEDEFLLTLTFYSGTAAMIFPYIRELAPYSNFDMGGLDTSTKRKVMRFYKRCVQRTLYLNGRSKIHLSKNPLFSTKVEALLDVFPDARFVVLMRNPYETVPSLLKMMNRNWKASDSPRNLIDDSLEAMGEQSILTYLHPMQVLKNASNPWMVVRYEELVERPLDVVTDVYQRLDIPMSDSVRCGLEAEQSKNKQYRAEHIYSLQEFGLSYREIREALAPVFDEFLWQEPKPDVTTSDERANPKSGGAS